MARTMNVARNALRPARAVVMAHKVYERVRWGVGRERAEAVAWADANAQRLDDWGPGRSPDLWKEACLWADAARADVQPMRADLLRAGVDMGGPGCIELLYFMTRLMRPEHVVETGVAAGWSTRAMLSAIDVNGEGLLSSSDFPFFRLEDPERHIGYAVPASLRAPWMLYLDGDRKNLGKVLESRPSISLVHYDSDKSRGGRQFFVRRITPYLTGDAVLIMDDIGDDLFFRDFSRSRDHVVFPYEGKHVGLIAGGWG